MNDRGPGRIVTIWTQGFVWYSAGFNQHRDTHGLRFAPVRSRYSRSPSWRPAAGSMPSAPRRRPNAPGGLSRPHLQRQRALRRRRARARRRLPDRTAQMSDSDLMLRLDRLETQIRQLTGVIEQLQFRNQQLEGQLRRLQEDTEYRFQELGAKGAARPALQSRPQSPPPQPPAPATTGAPGRRGDAFDPTQNPNAPGAPHTLGSVNAGAGTAAADAATDVRGGAGEPIGAPGGRGAGAPLDLATMGPPGGAPGPALRNPNAGGAVVATLPPSQTPRDEYDLAYGYVLRKDYALAEEGFRSFLSRYPGDRHDRRRHLLAGRKPVPASALPRRGRSFPQRLDQISRRPPRRRTRCCGSGSRLPRSARRKRPARRSARSCASFPAHRPA